MGIKKKIAILALLVTLISCGGGGGGGGGTSSPTPSIPSKPSTPSTPPSTPSTPSAPVESSKDSNGNIKWNDRTRVYDKNNPNNLSSAATSQAGAGVVVGVIDMGFSTTNAALQADMTNKFGTRLIKTNEHSNQTADEDHGITVAEVIGGNTNTGIAKGVTIVAADASTRNNKGEYHPDPTIGMYNDLYNRGARIFNQSFGVNSQVTDYDWNNPRAVEGQIGSDILQFYKDKVNEGVLFVWAAGNETFHNQPSLEPGLPYKVPELQKGWINVVGLANKYMSARPGETKWDELERLSGAGVAKNWTVTAVSGITYTSKGTTYGANGSSYAAPMVTATAALLKGKYPWMDGSLIRQTILSTATDIGKVGVDEDFGWGLLNVDKALKGPALFDKRLALADNVVVNVSAGTYTFSNDIAGDAGLIKNGPGTLKFDGKLTYTGNTVINNGSLIIKGTTYNAGATRIAFGNMVVADNVNIKNDIQNENGSLEVQGNNVTVGGNYTVGQNATTVLNSNSNLHVKGRVVLNGSKLELKSEKDGEAQYVTAKGVQSSITSDNKIEGNVTNIETGSMLNGNVENKGNSLNAILSRKNVEDYVSTSSVGDAMRNNVAGNLETSFKELDSQIERGNIKETSAFARNAALIQKMSLPTAAAVLDSLSGQIYASAQALTFQHSQTVNKDLSNRLVMLGTLDNVGDNAGLWVTGIGANGKLRQEGFGVGTTHVYGGQVGIDKAFGNSLILGTALSYSKSDVKFDRYGGESKADGFGVSLYGRLGNKEVPYYLQGRIGAGFITSNVERDILLGGTDTKRAKIEHKDKVLSGYLETGYDIKSGGFTLTPYIGISHDTVTRGAFNEENSQFGLKAEKKRYSQTSGLVGLRVGQSINWSSGSKTTFQGYVTQHIGFKEEDLSFEASYTGLANAKFKVKGIGLSRNSTWAGIGVLTEVNPRFAWYINYDAKMEKHKAGNNVFTTGFRINF